MSISESTQLPFGYPEFVDALFAKRNQGVEGAMHAAVGLAGEAGELLDAVKKTWVYGKRLDRDNAIEELGDLEFYAEALRANLGISLHELRLAGEKAVSPLYDMAPDPLLSVAADIHRHAGRLLSEVWACWHCGRNLFKHMAVDDLARLHLAMHHARWLLNATREHVLLANKLKLVRRYPGGYSDAHAIARLDKELPRNETMTPAGETT